MSRVNIKNGKVNGLIKFKGFAISFRHDGEIMEMKTVTAREPDESERNAISEFGEDLDFAIKRVLRKVDMSEAHDEAMRSAYTASGKDSLPNEEDFKRFVEKLNNELNGSKGRGEDSSDFLRKIFGKRDGQ